MRNSRLVVVSLALAVLASLTIVRLSVAAQKRPEDVSFTITIPAGEVLVRRPTLTIWQGQNNRSSGRSLHLHVTRPSRDGNQSRRFDKTSDAKYYRRVSPNNGAER